MGISVNGGGGMGRLIGNGLINFAVCIFIATVVLVGIHLAAGSTWPRILRVVFGIE